jgi:hypothetical protein
VRLREQAAARDRETDRRCRETDARVDKIVIGIGERMACQPNPQ